MAAERWDRGRVCGMIERSYAACRRRNSLMSTCDDVVFMPSREQNAYLLEERITTRFGQTVSPAFISTPLAPSAL